MLLLVLLTLFAGAHADAYAQKTTDRSKQKKIAESERADLRQKLTTLKRSIDKTETAKSSAADALAKSEEAISDAQRNLRDLSEEQRKTEARLKDLSSQQSELKKIVEAQQRQLAKLLREQYIAGNEDRIKLLLSGDNPNRINRELQYMGYVSRAQATLIESLRANLQAIADNQADVLNAKEELDEIAADARDQHAILQKEKAQRATLLAQLSSKLVTQRKEIGNIERDEKRLSSLVDKLAVLMQEQRKAEAAAAEKRKQERAAREREEREKRLAQAKKRGTPDDKTSSGKIANPNAIEDDEAPRREKASPALARNQITPELTPDAGIQDGAFAALRGKLRLPIRGDVTAKFGSKRGEGPTWKGLFIRAEEGTEVKAIAAGRVIFAEWLRGFGNLIIVDHGSQYMTIYGNNQSVLKHAGDAVKPGEVIASTGNSGGNEQSGLYFEMRHQGRAFDPLGWVTIR
ncbi:murein hydrolase activator EnvC family protein [Herminiimonas fonticola]|uniref:Septal ring factor EnvC (AmiA/AmiB activator) n=1 Tax=Herminiimonas fonticola TaxID=303380 RepID=A0A4R6GIV6_9BURK|nr:peptidoglycan DD-metalloendopeptidase family protein [Herminiimonas fonticola]RBA24960.1 Membrane-bound metallopeptidase [Herminiimonas fonticola]TDN94075.1 septal ring factor EnvC (AmiA/AmiB activator) [Herminiimonas fonticola]